MSTTKDQTHTLIIDEHFGYQDADDVEHDGRSAARPPRRRQQPLAR